MTQPSASARGPAEEPARDRRLAGFGQGGAGDTCPPGAALAAVVDELSGPERRCAGADDDELTGLLGRWDALASWAEAGKLGVIRELIRRRARPGLRGMLAMHGDLPGQWDEGMAHEVSAALGISVPSADKLICFAWDLQARLPGIGAALAAGTISGWTARLISNELAVLADGHAAQAEKLVLDQLGPQATPGMAGRLAARAAVTVDPGGAAARREAAEREQARVRLWRENGGACALAGYGLPADAALAASAAIQARAEDYKQAKVRPEAGMDQLRVLAFLDILNGTTVEARITQARAGQAGGTGTAGAGTAGAGTTDGDVTDDDAGGGDQPSPGDGPAGTPPGDDHGDGSTSAVRSSAPGGTSGGPAAAPARPALTARANLTLPLATLLGLADRPGTAGGLGPLDPALTRDLAAAAAASPHSQLCVTITGTDGTAIGHGCARPARTARTRKPKPPPASRDGPRTWAFTQTTKPGPPGGYGTWTLTLPGGRDMTVTLQPVPARDCDHRHETHRYHPGDTLRHLVQIRDGTCTFPTCTRPARETDFEHAQPYHHGGRTCACNAGARSRRCHKVKQSQGWTVTQPRPGWHQWTTPSGRTYTRGPMRYPA